MKKACALSSLLILTASLCLVGSVAVADDGAKLRAKIDGVKKDLLAKQRKIGVVESELESLNADIAKTSRQIASLRKQISSERESLTSLRQDLTEVRQQRLQNSGSVQQHVRTMYLLGSQPMLKIVLNQEDPAVAGRMMRYYDYLNRAYIAEIETLTKRQQRLQSLSDEIESRSDKLKSLLARHQKRLGDFEQQRGKREDLSIRLRDEEQDAQKRLEKLLSDYRQLERLAEKMGQVVESVRPLPATGIAFAKLKGSLPWPVKGKLLAKYGRARVSGGQLNWSGLLISADEGDSVRSVAPGRVVFSDLLRGYGYMVIIDHGAGYLSLYGHNQALFKEVGEQVERGEVIALVGQTGTVREPSLYFEIRHKGEPINPQRWIAQR